MIVDPDADLVHGAQIGRFAVAGVLGKGGMGVVYEAYDRELDRRVALKVLRAAAATDEERTRMLREGQAMARVTHPNVITVYEVGVQGDLVFLAQELLDAGTLGQWLEARRSHAEIIDKFVAAGRGLAAAHAAGLVHRDFKPDNVLLGKDGRVRVSDFGLARALGPADDGLVSATRANVARAQLELSRGPKRSEPANAGTRGGPMSPLTRTGAVMGTPMFMAPEQHNGDRADERSDQFSFCVALYYALHGDWPYAGKTTVALADAVIAGRLQPPPRGHRVPARLRRILLHGLATRPAGRYPSMTALLAELTRPPSRRARRGAIAIGALALVGGAVGGGYALRTRDEPAVVHRRHKAFDPKTLTSDRGVEWLTTAIERGQLDDALDKYAMAGTLAQDSGEAVQASVAWSGAALLDALRGRLAEARTRLRDAEAGKGTDPIAIAYADLAAAAVAAAGGELEPALARSARCASEFAATVPELAAMCFELHGRAAAERGDAAAARAAYSDGLALAQRLDNAPSTLQLELAGAALDLDEDKLEAVAAHAAALQASASERGAASPEAQAWVLLARAHLAQAATQQALDDLDHVKPDAIEPIAIRLQALIARGEAVALLGDPDGVGQIEAARAEVARQGYVGLAFAARLARVDVATLTAAPDAAALERALVADARAHGFERIAQLAETAAQR